MNKYLVDTSDKKNISIKDCAGEIVSDATAYLKHKTNENCSSTTLIRIARSIIYYLLYIEEMSLTMEQVLMMKYAEQYAHFVSFLNWLKAGKHCNRKDNPQNKTCNLYLMAVFGYYMYTLLQNDLKGDIKVLEGRMIGYTSAEGVSFRRNAMTFRGYLPPEDTKSHSIDKPSIVKILEACNNIRNKLLILLLEETGVRIGELLGVKYTEDIDFANKMIKVTPREDNENEAHAKYHEYRHVRISDETYDLLMLYLSRYRDELSKTEFLFICLHGPTKGEPLKVNAVYSAFRNLEKKTGIKFTPHYFRHYAANERRKAGWDLMKIRDYLGQRHLRTTERYLHVEYEELKSVMDDYYKVHGSLYDINSLI